MLHSESLEPCVSWQASKVPVNTGNNKMMGSVRSAGWALLGTCASQGVWFDFVVFQGTGEPVFVPPE